MGDDSETPNYDMALVRRRRRRNKRGDRCRASKLQWNQEDDPVCPLRESCWCEGTSSSCDSEWSKSKQCHWWCSFKQRKDWDCSGSYDFKFARKQCSGAEADSSMSMHCRYKSSASSASESCHSDESNEIMPMDPRRDLFHGVSAPGGDSEDSCVRIGSEFSYSSGRSKDNVDDLCGPMGLNESLGAEGNLNGASFKALGGDYLCQWTCDSDTMGLFVEASESEWICESEWNPNASVKTLSLSSGHRVADCEEQCANEVRSLQCGPLQTHVCGQCGNVCVEQCKRIMSASLNAGGAQCRARFFSPRGATLQFPTYYHFDRGLSAGGLVLFMFVALCLCGSCGGPLAWKILATRSVPRHAEMSLDCKKDVLGLPRDESWNVNGPCNVLSASPAPSAASSAPIASRSISTRSASTVDAAVQVEMADIEVDIQPNPNIQLGIRPTQTQPKLKATSASAPWDWSERQEVDVHSAAFTLGSGVPAARASNESREGVASTLGGLWASCQCGTRRDGEMQD